MAGHKYEYKLLHEIHDSLLCVICHELVKEAHQHGSCGKIFCKVCIQGLVNKSCPNCRGDDAEYFADKLSELILQTASFDFSKSNSIIVGSHPVWCLCFI